MNDTNKIKQLLRDNLGKIIEGKDIILERQYHIDKDVITFIPVLMLPFNKILACQTHHVDIDVFITIFIKHFSNRVIKNGTVLNAIINSESKKELAGKPTTGYLPFLLQWRDNDITF